jgi:hypothetical protein
MKSEESSDSTISTPEGVRKSMLLVRRYHVRRMVPITARTTNAQWIRTGGKSGKRERPGEAQKNRSEKTLTAA